MGHSAEYQTELDICDLEYVVQILDEQADKLYEAGAQTLAAASVHQSEQLQSVIVLLRRGRDRSR